MMLHVLEPRFPLVDEAAIRDLVGDGAYAAGRIYVHDGRVNTTSLVFDRKTGFLVGAVQGEARQPYICTVRFTGASQGPARLTDFAQCTCPVHWACKHIAALLVVAGALASHQMTRVATPAPTWRQAARAAVGADPYSDSWESRSDYGRNRHVGTTVPSAPASVPEPVALQFRVTEHTPYGSFGAQRWKASIQVRVARRGKRQGWVGNTGQQWGSIHPQWGAPGFSPPQIRWFADMDRMRRDPYGHGTWMNLSEFDSSLLWLHLARAESMGVQLVGEDPKDTIALADAIDPVIDLTATETGGVRLARRVRIDGVVVDMAGIVAVGATGYAANIVDGDHKVLVVGPHGRAARPEETDAIGGEVTVVPGCDLEEFRTTFLAGLIQRAEVLSTDGSVEVPEPVAPVAVLRLEVRGPDRLDAEWWWAYGEAADDAARIPLGSSATVQGIRRDAAAELSILSQVAAVCRRWPRLPMPGAPRERTGRVGDAGRDGDATRRGVPVRGTDVIDLVTGLIPDLTGIDGVRVEVVGELPDLRERTEAPHLTITATASDDSTDWLDLGVTVRVEGVDVPFRDLFAALAQGQDRMILADGTYIRLDQPAFAQLRALIEEADRLSDNPTRPQVSRYDASLWGELEELADETQADTPWIESLATLRALADSGETPAPLPAPEGLVATLRPYQHRAFEWLAFLWHHRIGGILADDMGLGKTVEALTLIAHTREAARGRVREGDAELVRAGAIGSSGAGGCDPEPGRPPFLVVAPSSVVGNWVSEAARFTPHLTVRALTQTRAKHGVPLDAEARGADVLVTSYAIFRLDHAEFAALEWDGLILDEAQFAKNHLTRANQCARALRAPFKLAVTGTPMENSVEELWAVFAIVAPGLLGTRRRFKEDYAGPIAEEAGGFPRPALDQLRRRIRPLLMRRTKEEVAPELPERTEQVIQVELAKAHRRAYDTFLHRERRRLLGLLSDFNANRFAIFRSLTLLRRMALDASLISPQYLGTPSSKLDVLFTQLGDVIGGGHRALVFSQFTTYLRKVAERLDADGIDYAYLDGTTTRRPAVINGFKKGTAPVFLISLKAGGFGLNLTEADYVFLLDPWWNPATENQAIDRTHRIGQTKPVMVTRLVSADTIEDKVMALKERKAALFNAVLDDDGTFSDSLSAADIRTLLGE